MALEYEQKPKVQIALRTCCASLGPGVLLVLQELFSQATLQAWSTAETDPEAVELDPECLKFTIQTCKPEGIL